MSRDIDELLALMTPSQRRSFRRHWFWRGVGSWLIHRIPGGLAAVRARHRVSRQGLTGLWEPVFSPTKQDFDRADARLRWHGWGVLADGGCGFRGVTPTSRTALAFSTPRAAWEAVDRRYRLGDRAPDAWEKR